MLKSDWVKKEKEFLEMQKKSREHKIIVEKQLEELDLFLHAVRTKIKTFK